MFMKIGRLFISVVLISLVFSSCKRIPTDVVNNNNHYDPRNVSRNEGESLAPSLAVDDIGNVHLVWADYTPGNWEILYSTKSPGGDWSEPVNISKTSNESVTPGIAIDKSGTLHLVWKEGTFGVDKLRILYSMKVGGENWSVPVQISENRGEIPKISVDDMGNIHVTWSGLGVEYRMKLAEGLWMPQEDVFPFDMNHDHAVNKQGDVHVVSDGRANDIFYTVKPFTERVNVSDSPAFSWAPDIAVDDGNVYVAWKEAKIGVDQIFFRILASNGLWSEIDSLPDIVGEGTSFVSIAAKDGDLHFLWNAVLGMHEWDIYYKARYKDGSWSEVSNISNTGEAGPGVIGSDTYGNLHITWVDESPGNYDIFYTVIQRR